MDDKLIKENKLFAVSSLSQWVLASFLLVTLPLVLVIVDVVIEVENYNQQSQKTLFQTVSSNENSRIILERVVSMERSIRQFLVLNEEEIFQSYLTHRNKFIDASKTLKTKNLDDSILKKIEQLSRTETNFYNEFIKEYQEKKQPIKIKSLSVFDDLTHQARALLAEGEERLGVEAEILAKSSQRVRQRLVYSALASIPLALFLGIILVNLLTRPIKSIGKAIRSLGEEGYDQEISIKGPKDLRELGLHLNWLRKKLSELEYEKQQFIRNISHELKTPLATLKEGTNLLDENLVGELNAEQQEIVQLMKMGNITINDLVDNLLEYQKAISTNVEVKLTKFELAPLINRVLNDYKLVLKNRKIDVKVNLCDASIEADQDKIRVIMSNLISNAIKFSPEGGLIGLSLEVEGDELVLVVEDQGEGVAEESKHLIFEEFYQGATPKSWSIKGSGLGLALVKYYLKFHRGRIELLQSNGLFCGARFSLRLPINREITRTK